MKTPSSQSISSPSASLGQPNKLRHFLIFLGLITPTLAVIFFSYFRMKNDLTRFAMERREVLADLAAMTLKERFDRLSDLSLSLSDRVLLKDLGEQGKWEEAVESLSSTFNDFPYLERIFLTDPQGVLQADLPIIPEVRGGNFSFREWYQGVLRTGKPYLSDIYIRTAEPRWKVIGVAVPIKNDHEKILGILVLQIRVDRILAWANQIELGPGAFLYLVDRKGQVATAPRPEFKGNHDYSKIPSVQKVLGGKRGSEIFFDPITKEKLLTAYSPIADYGWGVMIQEPLPFVFSSPTLYLRKVIRLFAVVFFLNGVLAWTVIRILAERQKAQKALEENLTDLKKTEEAFTEVYHSLNMALKAGRVATWSYDIAADRASLDEDCMALHGIAPANFKGTLESFLELFPAGEREKISSGVQKTFSEGKDFRVEYRRIGLDGKERYLSSQGEVFYGKEGTPQRVAGVSWDITEQRQFHELLQKEHDMLEKRVRERAAELTQLNKKLEADIAKREKMEKILEEREYRLRTIFNSEPECVKLLDTEGNLLDMNPSGLKMIEADAPEEVMGQCIYPLIKKEFREAFTKLVETVFEGKPAKLEFQINTLKGKTRWMDSSATPLCNPEGKTVALLAITRDITERKEMENELRKTLQNLQERTDRLERFQKITVGRELQMIRLKQEINELRQKQGLPLKFKIAGKKDLKEIVFEKILRSPPES